MVSNGRFFYQETSTGKVSKFSKTEMPPPKTPTKTKANTSTALAQDALSALNISGISTADGAQADELDDDVSFDNQGGEDAGDD